MGCKTASRAAEKSSGFRALLTHSDPIVSEVSSGVSASTTPENVCKLSIDQDFLFNSSLYLVAKAYFLFNLYDLDLYHPRHILTDSIRLGQ